MLLKLRRGVSTAVLGAGLVAGSGVPMVEARGSGGASSLFADAEASMASTIKSYRGVKDEWQSARRLVDGAKVETSAGKATTQSILTDTLAVGGKLAGILAEQTSSVAAIKEQITAQQATTALKYEAAEAAAADPRKRPAYTAALFKAGQSEAAVLETVEGILRDFKEVEGQSQEAAKRVAKISQDIQASIDRLAEAESDLTAGVAQLERGVSPALVDRTGDNFRDLAAGSGNREAAAGPDAQGAKLFALGVSGVDAAVGKSQTTLRSLRDTCTALSAAGAEIDRLDARVAGVVDRTADWEKEFKLSAGKAGQLVKQDKGQVDKLRELSAKAGARACAASDKRDEEAVKTKKANKSGVIAGLRSVQGRLEVAERRTAETEALIRSASQKGAEEAKRFRKFIPARAEAAAVK